MTTPAQNVDGWALARTMLIAGSLIIAISLGIRHSFGLFLQPISMEAGWGREVFALAIAVQNLVWGIAQPFTGMLSDRFGAGKVILGGAALYTAGLVAMAIPQDPTVFVLSTGLLIGLGLSATSFPIVFGAISRAMPADKRSHAMGIAMSIGSFGQFAILPIALGMIDGMGWVVTMLIFSAISCLILPLSLPLMERGAAKASSAPGATAAAVDTRTPGEAFGEAMRSRDFWLLSTGFFVCGFHVIFIATHLPAFLADEGMQPSVASIVLALIGLANIAGTYYAGLWGGQRSKPMLLSWIYLGRAIAIALFILLPITPWTAYAFGVLMGLFWLSTVPLTNGIVAAIFGVKNMAMLGGLVFLAHQVGSFLGGWLGGYLYDQTGSYNMVWWIAILLGLLAAAINLPIREKPIEEIRAAKVTP